MSVQQGLDGFGWAIGKQESFASGQKLAQLHLTLPNAHKDVHAIVGIRQEFDGQFGCLKMN